MTLSLVDLLPKDYLSMRRENAAEFFFVFSRFEYALKLGGFARAQNPQKPQLEPDWEAFALSMRQMPVARDSDLYKAIRYLCSQPPQVQTGATTWVNRPLGGVVDAERAIFAAVRVRNNLFHGGKHFGPAAEGRDNELVGAAMVVLSACLDSCEPVRKAYGYDV
jgi:hypothetical protein